MRTIIAGSREINNYFLIKHALAKLPWEITTVISGHARGPDKLGELWAKENNIPLEIYPADWDYFGKRAGYIRNELMAQKAEALVAFWDGKSKGTEHMINIAKEYSLRTIIFRG